MDSPDVSTDTGRLLPAERKSRISSSLLEYLMTSSDGIDKCEITITEDLGVFIYLFSRN